MFTISALFAIVAGGWGTFEKVCDISADFKNKTKMRFSSRLADFTILILCASCVITAFHSLACIWVR